MVKKSQIIFMEGKEKALDALFGDENATFGYLAIGFQDTSGQNGFEDPLAVQNNSTPNGFMEIQQESYKRIKLEKVTDGVVRDPDSGKVLRKYQAVLENSNITQSQDINQIAVVDNQNIDAETTIYSATTFQTFNKTNESSITFVIGFRI